MNTKLTLTAFLCSISDDKKFIFEIDEATYNRITVALKENKGYLPIKKSDNGKHYLSMSLDRFERKNVKKYLVYERKTITFTIELIPYKFTNESEMEVEGVGAELLSIKAVLKDQPKIVSPVPIKVSSIEAQLLALSAESDSNN